ncbi:hypothetical protein ACFWPQ_33710 [Streptomyces sp. NPDC058464]|uniref:hypothetical protein n=1 Tax=Streptomyces sp. NPDC058464 TaxID=3346511 RepID=UPI00365A7B20
MDECISPDAAAEADARLMTSRKFSGVLDFNDYLILEARCRQSGDERLAYAREQLSLGRTGTARLFFFAGVRRVSGQTAPGT